MFIVFKRVSDFPVESVSITSISWGPKFLKVCLMLGDTPVRLKSPPTV